MQLQKNNIFFLILSFLFFACKKELPYLQIEGKTMGTYYKVTYQGNQNVEELKTELDSILLALNMEVSTYIEDALISKFNQSSTGILIDTLEFEHFWKNYRWSENIHLQSHGAFDPTVMPLVNYWGFGYQGKKQITSTDSTTIDSLLILIGMDNLSIQSGQKNAIFLQKNKPGVQLDFSAVAKGYGVDLLGIYLEIKGIENYLVDIGGEIRAKGKNSKNQVWTIGISEPLENSPYQSVYSIVELSNQSMATSGNYRNFYEVNGQKYSHTINPFNGFPERQNLLSASVIAPNCAQADAWATAFMVMGLEKSIEMAKKIPDIETYFIFNDGLDSLKSIHIKK
jgi:thiamine biosynthesis lipoprotein